MTDAQFNRKLLKISILTDILEAEIKAINPNETIKDTVFKMKLNNSLLSSKNLRLYFDRLFGNLAELTGNYYDAIDSVIEEKINELDTKTETDEST